MPIPFTRGQTTWLMYLMLSFYGYLLNILGPITPFLMEEFKLSYTLSSMHFTAFAAGMILVGLGGHYFIDWIGRRKAIWTGAFLMSLGSIMLVTGKIPAATILACLLMGTAGSLIPALVSSVLSDQYGLQRAIALAEANFCASTASAIAPLMVGWFAHLYGFPLAGWRLALAVAVFIPVLLWIAFSRLDLPMGAAGSNLKERAVEPERKPLPGRYWIFWMAIVLAVSIEFCMIFWSADYLEKILLLPKAAAAQFVSLVLGGMILGRLLGSRLVQRSSEKQGILLSLGICTLGFLLFWRTGIPILCLAGLFVTGLGIANLYPFLLSLALASAGNQVVQASARSLLASGVAILCLPMILGRLADQVGINLAFSVIIFLLAGLFIVIISERKSIPVFS